MTFTRKIALAALFTVIAAPAFASDQDSAALAVSGGRYLPQAQSTTAFSGAYASAVNPKDHHATHGTVPTGDDFQLDGR